ncbi:MAG: flagellar hook-basal body complex protein FliE [Lachnospiraceae bacterium]
MSQSFITPINVVKSAAEWNETPTVKGSDGSSLFKNVFENAIENVSSSEQELANQEYLLSTGQIDNAHTVPIAAAKAQLSVELLVQLRNKALEAYTEMIKINV